MRNSFYVAVLSLALAGCGADQPPATATAPGTTPATTIGASTSYARQSRAALDSALKAVSSEAPISVRYDRLVQDQAGNHQRQVFVEMLGASAAQTEVFATKALTAAGFSAHRGRDDANGIRLQYKKKGAEPINVLIRDKKASPPMKAAKATSSLYVRQTVL